MATSSTQRSGSNRNRRRSGGGRDGNNRNRQGGGGGGSSRSGGYIRSKVPRKAPEPSLGQKILKIVSFGMLGGKIPDAPKKPGPAKRSDGSRNSDRNANRDSNRNSRNGSGERRRENKGSERRESHSPELVEVTTGRLYVGNLSYDAAESDLIELFNGVGAVSSAEVVSHRRTQRSKGYAFVVMNNVDEAKRAVEVLHDKDFMGRKLVVSGAKSPGVRSGESSDGGDSSSNHSDSSDADSSEPTERPTYGE